MTGPQWRKPSICADSSCVELALTDEAVLVRESRYGRYGPVLSFSPDEWRAFMAGAKAGEFDWPEEATVTDG